MIGYQVMIYVSFKKSWELLAAKYDNKTKFDGTSIGWIRASINGVDYANAFRLKYNHEGIHLLPMLFLRTFYKPVMIPWTEIEEIQEKKVDSKMVSELKVGHPQIATIQFQKKDFARVQGDYLSYRSV